jgi:hypothetical protein
MPNQITVSSLLILEIINEYRGLRGLQTYQEHSFNASIRAVIPCAEAELTLDEAKTLLTALGESEEVWWDVVDAFRVAGTGKEISKTTGIGITELI